MINFWAFFKDPIPYKPSGHYTGCSSQTPGRNR